MSEAAPTIGKAETVGLIGPMKDAWAQTFGPGIEAALAPCLIIVWHAEWLYPHHALWAQLSSKLAKLRDKDKISILVVIFGDSPDALGEDAAGNPLKVLLRALAQDADPTETWRPGWASISNVEKFKDFAVPWTYSEASSLVKLTTVCAAVSAWSQDAQQVRPVNLSQFFHFWADPVAFRASILHGAAHPEQERLRLSELKWLVTLAQIPRSIPLKILIVENAPKEVCNRNIEAGNLREKRSIEPPFATLPLAYLGNAEFYLVTASFDSIATGSRESVKAKKVSHASWGDTAVFDDCATDTTVRWKDIDLVLQDVMLESGTGKITGLTLAPFYFDVCPQALVFLLTGLDVESLVSSGDVNWKYVDAVIPKHGLDTLWWEYYRCFRQKMGRMFWPEWVRPEIDTAGDGALGTRHNLRELFACLRKWQREPMILGHGQGVAEMIDHADRHIGCLWRMTDDFVGEYLENAQPPQGHLTLEDRMLLSMAVWLHDIGHRGDEFHDESADVRMFHAGISERLLLRDPKAFGLEWLLKCRCSTDCAVNDSGRSNRLCSCRNKRTPKDDKVCPLRAVGLLCRHHQSNSPLNPEAFSKIQAKGKTLSPYARVRGGEGVKHDFEDDLSLWTDATRPLEGWQGSSVRTLMDFTGRHKSLTGIAGLLRMLDGIQFHRTRVGSRAAIDSFQSFLSNRHAWAERQIGMLESDLARMRPGSHEYLMVMGTRQKMEKYKYLVTIQHIHFWQQRIVHDVEVCWRWKAGGDALLDVGYILDEQALKDFEDYDRQSLGDPEETSQKLREVVDKEHAVERNELGLAFLALSSPAAQTWATHSVLEFIKKEHDSQDSTLPYTDPLGDHITFQTSVLGLTSERFPSPEKLFPYDSTN